MVQEEYIEELVVDKTIVDTVTPEDNIKLKNDEIYKEWEKNMHDFIPEDLTNFLINGNSAAVFYEEINHQTPTVVKGAYYVHGGLEATEINVFI